MEYVVPGFGVYDDTNQGFCPVVPGFGIICEQAEAGVPRVFVTIFG